MAVMGSGMRQRLEGVVGRRHMRCGRALLFVVVAVAGSGIGGGRSWSAGSWEFAGAGTAVVEGRDWAFAVSVATGKPVVGGTGWQFFFFSRIVEPGCARASN